VPWFLVTAQCVGPSCPDPSEAFYDLDDETIAVVGVRASEERSTDGRRPLELELAIEAQNASVAAAQVKAILAADPDFELIAVGEGRPTTNPRALSGEAQQILCGAADELRDELREDIQILRNGRYEDTIAVSRHLPIVFSRHYTLDVIAGWAGSVETVAHKMAAYPDTYLASTAEELAGHALIERSEELVDECEDDLDDPDALREKFSEVHDLAFEDHDVLMLFDARLDGLEDSGIGTMMGVVNLHPRDWFKPFRAAE
jgi:hypothetical protein